MIGEVLALFASFCWALAAVLYKKVLEHKGYFIVNLLRVAFASIFLAFVFLFINAYSLFLASKELFFFIFAAVNGIVIGDTLYFIGLKRIGVSRTQSISSSYPLYSMLLAAIFLNEKLNFTIILATPLIVFGIILVIPIEEKTYLVDRFSMFSLVAPVLTAFFWSISLITFKFILINGCNPIFAVFINRVISLPFLFFIAASTKELTQIRNLSKLDLFLVAIAGIISLGIGGISLFLSLSSLNASKAIPLSSISPFFAFILAFIYNKEKLNAKIVAGTTFIIIGVILLTLF
jgi:drug/metabolite transporter (DMT)-like permease